MQTKLSQYYFKQMSENPDCFKKIKGRYTYCLAHLNKPEYRNAYNHSKDIVTNSFLGELQSAHTAWFKLGHNFEVLREQVVNHYTANQNIIWMAAVYQICMIECPEIQIAIDSFNLAQANIESNRKDFFMKEEAKSDYAKRKNSIVSDMNNLDQKIREITNEKMSAEKELKEKLKLIHSQKVSYNKTIDETKAQIIAEEKRLEEVTRKMNTSSYGVELAESRKYMMKNISDMRAQIVILTNLVKELDIKTKFFNNQAITRIEKQKKIIEVLKSKRSQSSKALGQLNMSYHQIVG